MKTKFSTGYVGTIKNHNALNTAAKMPHTTVAKLLAMYPIIIHRKLLNITVNVGNNN